MLGLAYLNPDLVSINHQIIYCIIWNKKNPRQCIIKYTRSKYRQTCRQTLWDRPRTGRTFISSIDKVIKNAISLELSKINWEKGSICFIWQRLKFWAFIRKFWKLLIYMTGLVDNYETPKLYSASYLLHNLQNIWYLDVFLYHFRFLENGQLLWILK